MGVLQVLVLTFCAVNFVVAQFAHFPATGGSSRGSSRPKPPSPSPPRRAPVRQQVNEIDYENNDYDYEEVRQPVNPKRGRTNTRTRMGISRPSNSVSRGKAASSGSGSRTFVPQFQTEEQFQPRISPDNKRNRAPQQQEQISKPAPPPPIRDQAVTFQQPRVPPSPPQSPRRESPRTLPRQQIGDVNHQGRPRQTPQSFEPIGPLEPLFPNAVIPQQGEGDTDGDGVFFTYSAVLGN